MGIFWAAHKFTAKNPALHQIGIYALNQISYFGALAAAHANYDHALVQTGSLNAAFTSGVLSYASSYIGGNYGPLAAGLVGGISADLQGGKFGHGFWSAFIMTGIGPSNTGNPYANVVIDAVIGGTSRLTGGKFKNGAATAAFFAALRQDWDTRTEDERWADNIGAETEAMIANGGKGLLADNSDFYENIFWKGEHFYSVTNSICSIGVNTCSVDEVAWVMLEKGVYPNQRRSLTPYINSSVLGNVKMFGDDHIMTYVGRHSITNTTLGDHFLSPGYVTRSVFAIDQTVFIRTIGGGWGYFGGLNNAGKNVVWGDVDRLVSEHFK